MKLITENWQDSKNLESVLHDPDFEAIGRAFNELDGDVHTLLVLELASGVVLHAGGGPEQYISQVINGDTCMLAKGSPEGERALQLNVGGQISEFDSEASLTHEQARDILLVFYHGEGILSTTVNWDVT